MALPRWLSGKGSACKWDTQQKQVEPLGGEDPQEEDMATHASIPAWRVPWAEEPARPKYVGLQRAELLTTGKKARQDPGQDFPWWSSG